MTSLEVLYVGGWYWCHQVSLWKFGIKVLAHDLLVCAGKKSQIPKCQNMYLVGLWIDANKDCSLNAAPSTTHPQLIITHPHLLCYIYPQIYTIIFKNHIQSIIDIT